MFRYPSGYNRMQPWLERQADAVRPVGAMDQHVFPAEGQARNHQAGCPVPAGLPLADRGALCGWKSGGVPETDCFALSYDGLHFLAVSPSPRGRCRWEKS